MAAGCAKYCPGIVTEGGSKGKGGAEGGAERGGGGTKTNELKNKKIKYIL